MSRNRILHLGIGLLLALFLWTVSGVSPAAAAPEALCATDTNLYRSAATGNWAANATWEVSTDGGTNWNAAGCWPSSLNGAISIRNMHTVTVGAAITVDEVTINTGGTIFVASGQTLTVASSGSTDLDIFGTLTINQTGADGIVSVAGIMRLNTGGTITANTNDITFQAGSRYVHNQNGGTIQAETWNAASTVEVTGVTNTAPGGLGQTFGNFTWNNAGQSASVSLAGGLTTVNGDLTLVSTGGGASEVQLVNTSGADLTLTIGGSLNIQGGNLDLFNSADGNDMTVNIGGVFNQTGGSLTSGNTTSASVINFTGASGQFTQSGGTFTTTNINFNVNNGAILLLNNNLSVATGRTFSVLNGGTLNTGTNVISGAGTFALASGGTLGIGSPDGITTAGTATGNIQTTTRTYNVGGNYVYNGTVDQNTGTGYPNNLTGDLIINNPGNTVTLNAARTIANVGLVNLVAGTLEAGTNLTMASTSTINRSEGSLTGTPQGGGTYDVNYTGNSKTTGTELAGSGLRAVTVNLTAGQTLTLDANRAPDGNLTITAGTFDLSTFTINRSVAGGILVVSSGATLKIGGTNSFPTNYNTLNIGVTSTVEYAGTTQNVAVLAGAAYGHLIISGSGTKMLAGTETVAGNLTINGGTFDLTTFTINRSAAGGSLTIADGASLKIGGTNTIPANYTTHAVGATSTIEFAGTAQSIPALNSSQSYGHLTTSGSGNKTLAAAISVRGNWTNNGGTIVPGAGIVTFNGTTTQTISGNVTPFNNLTINANAIVVIPATNIPTVAGTMTNNGTLQQTLNVDNTAPVSFLTISTDKYRGVDIDTTGTGANLGAVTVSIRGNSGLTCPNAGGVSPVYVLRCFDITVTNQGAAAVTLWATTGEQNGILTDDLTPYRFSGSWSTLTGVTNGTGSNNYIFAEGDTPGFSTFLLGDAGFSPTAITLSQVGVVSGMGGLWVVLAGLLLVVSAGWWVRGKVNSKQ